MFHDSVFKPRLLVTGASGFLGAHLCRASGGQFLVHGTYFSRLSAASQIPLAQCDLTSFDRTSTLIDRAEPEVIIHCAAMSSPDECEAKPNQARKIIVDATRYLCQLCELKGIRLVFISTDLVFDGTGSPYNEEDPVSALNTYGKLKAEAEALVQSCPDSLVIRLPLLFGNRFGTANSFLQKWIEFLGSSQKIKAFIDEFRTPVSGERAAKGILHFLNGPEGILHLGGAERISRYEMALKVAEIFGFDESLVEASSQKDVITPAFRPSDVSLDSSKAFASGFDPGTFTDELQKIKLQY